MPRWKITIEYDGTTFCGWQKQGGDEFVTVQQIIEEAIFNFSREKVEIYGSGRTDSGVHAVGQVAHFDLEREVEAFKICEAINFYLNPYDVSITSAEKVEDDFHARFSAKKRHYHYKILNRKCKSPINKNRAWLFPYDLDEKLMQEAADLLMGKHDFTTFRATRCQSKSPIKTIDKIKIVRDGDFIYMDISAQSFMHHQVRNIIGTLAMVGDGRWTIEDFKNAFEACDRTKGGVTAPACGLYFTKIDY